MTNVERIWSVIHNKLKRLHAFPLTSTAGCCGEKHALLYMNVLLQDGKSYQRGGHLKTALSFIIQKCNTK